MVHRHQSGQIIRHSSLVQLQNIMRQFIINTVALVAILLILDPKPQAYWAGILQAFFVLLVLRLYVVACLPKEK